MRDREKPRDILPLLIALLLLIGTVLGYVIVAGPGTESARVAVSENAQYLAAAAQPARQGFRFQEVPAWLFVHVALIAACQVLALIGALHIARRDFLTRGAVKSVQFLCEVPMYLGLFGTLLGVCLTQFVTGSLVAPLAYLTTMSGIVLHVLGKLMIWLPLPGENELDDEA